jgi:hypothetical protein
LFKRYQIPELHAAALKRYFILPDETISVNCLPMQHFIHYFLHLILPGIIAYVFYRSNWLKVYGLLLLTMLVDLDHLLANPVFEPCRCSINFHPLHSYQAIGFYFILLLFPKTRVIALGLLLHMATDALDCFFSYQRCG